MAAVPAAECSGLARILGESGIMGSNPVMEDILTESILVADEQEKLVALQAIETYRALKRAVKDAPHGHGLAFTEAVVHDKGFDHLRKMYESALRDHPEAQKKGPAVLDVRAGKRRHSAV